MDKYEGVGKADQIEEEDWKSEICQQEKVKIRSVRAMTGG